MPEFGSPHQHLRLTESTNDVARELADEGAPSGTVVTASEQSAGRGRRGRVWSAPAGKALLYSAILRPLELEHALLPLSVPVAVCEAVYALTFADADPGDMVLLVDSAYSLALAVNRGNASRQLDLEPGDRVVLTVA